MKQELPVEAGGLFQNPGGKASSFPLIFQNYSAKVSSQPCLPAQLIQQKGVP